MPVKGCRGPEVDDRHLNGSGRLNHQCIIRLLIKPFPEKKSKSLLCDGHSVRYSDHTKKNDEKTISSLPF